MGSLSVMCMVMTSGSSPRSAAVKAGAILTSQGWSHTCSHLGVSSGPHVPTRYLSEGSRRASGGLSKTIVHMSLVIGVVSGLGVL